MQFICRYQVNANFSVKPLKILGRSVQRLLRFHNSPETSAVYKIKELSNT